QAPAGRAPASNRRVGMLPEGGEPRRLGRRFGTFGLVIGGGLAATLGLALGLRGLATLLGWQAADSNALALLAVPVAWGALATLVMMLPRRRSQLAVLAISALPAVPVVVAELLS